MKVLWILFWINIGCILINLGFFLFGGFHWYSLAVIPFNVFAAWFVYHTINDLRQWRSTHY